MLKKEYKRISKKIINNKINLINSSIKKDKEGYKKEIKRLDKLRSYILKKLKVFKNYNDIEIENFIIWNI